MLWRSLIRARHPVGFIEPCFPTPGHRWRPAFGESMRSSTTAIGSSAGGMATGCACSPSKATTTPTGSDASSPRHHGHGHSTAASQQTSFNT